MKTEIEPIILKLRHWEDISMDGSSRVYYWCKENGVKYEQPRDKKTGLYKTSIIHLVTLKQQFLFQEKFTGLLKQIAKNQK